MDADFGARRRSGGSRRSRRSRRSRSRKSEKSYKSEKSFKSARKYLKYLAKKPYKAYKAHKQYVKEADRKHRARSSVLDSESAHFMALQALNFAAQIDKLNTERANATGRAVTAEDNLTGKEIDYDDDSNWDVLKKSAKEYFQTSDKPKQQVNQFKYLIVGLEKGAANDEALSRVLAMSAPTFNTPLGKKVLQQLIRVVYRYRPDMKRTLKMLEQMYMPRRYAIKKGLYPPVKKDFTYEKTRDSSSSRVF